MRNLKGLVCNLLSLEGKFNNMATNLPCVDRHKFNGIKEDRNVSFIKLKIKFEFS